MLASAFQTQNALFSELLMNWTTGHCQAADTEMNIVLVR
jgi:hypothetical protein